MVVPVLITSCQVSEYLNTGPLMPHIIITAKAIPNAGELPVQQVIFVAIFSKNESFCFSINQVVNDVSKQQQQALCVCKKIDITYYYT